MLCLQERKLLDTGEYMVISVNDEFYNPDLKTAQESRQSEFYLKPIETMSSVVELADNLICVRSTDHEYFTSSRLQ